MIVIIDYGAGNIASIQNALSRLGVKSTLSNKASEIQEAKGIIIPGVGQAKYAMEQLEKSNLIQIIQNLKQPVLGICLGQQLLCQKSDEGNVACIGIFDSVVKTFPKHEILPHMGWNTLKKTNSDLFKGLESEFDVYYVHNYYCTTGKDTCGISDYILPFSGAFQKDNFYGVQFHPEKSGEVGEKIIKNFIQLCD
jgi:imidazole glycerol-phosphate synthase subunit HisH